MPFLFIFWFLILSAWEIILRLAFLLFNPLWSIWSTSSLDFNSIFLSFLDLIEQFHFYDLPHLNLRFISQKTFDNVKLPNNKNPNNKVNFLIVFNFN